MDKLYVGIDVSSRNNVVCLMKPDGTKNGTFYVPNSPSGSEKLIKQTLSALTANGLTNVVFGLEATGCYGDHLVYYLKESALLANYNRKIHVLNPKQVKKFRENYNDLPKNDYLDAFVIADCLRFGRINKEVYISDPKFKALQTLTRQRFHIVKELAAEKQRMINIIFKKYSSLAQDKVFSDRFGASAMALYEEFESADTLAYMDLHDLTDFLVKKGKNRFKDPEAVANAIQKAAKGSYRLPKTVNDSINQTLSVSISLIRALEQQVKVLDKAIAAQMEIIPNTLTSVKGIGPVYSAGIIAEIGDIHRFDNQAGLAKYAGLAWKQKQSGDFDSEIKRCIPSGNKFLKYYLCEAAFSLVRCDTEYNSFYHRKYNEVNRCQHKRALALTARKFVRLVFALLKDNKLYIPSEA